MKLNTRIIIIYVIVSIFVISVAAFSLYKMNQAKTSVASLTNTTSQKVKFVEELQETINSIHFHVDRFLQSHQEEDQELAEVYITHMKQLLRDKPKSVFSVDHLQHYQSIETLFEPYLQKFHNLKLRIGVVDKNTQNLIALQQEAHDHLKQISFSHDLSKDDYLWLMNQVFTIESLFLKGHELIYQYQPEHTKTHVALLNQTLKEFLEWNAHSHTQSERLKTDVEFLYELFEEYINEFEGVMSLTAKIEEEIRQTMEPVAPKILLISQKLSDEHWQEMNHQSEVVTNQIELSLWLVGGTLVAAGGGGAAFVVILFLFILNRVVRPAHQILQFANQIAAGNLLIEDLAVSGQDEVAQLGVAMNQMKDDLYQQQQALRSSNEQLAEQALELEHQHQQLKDTQTQLIQAAKLSSLGEMATGIAHEINQPLMGISLRAGVLEEEVEDREPPLPEDEFFLKKLREISSLVDRASLITSHLRKFARESKIEHQEAHDFNQVVEGSLLLVSEQLRVRSIDLQKEYAESLPQVRCNMIHIEQVIANLVSNARDAMEDSDTKVLSLKTYQEAGWVFLEVSDTGGGIPEDIQEKVFNPFFTSKEVGKGTGLGLSISFSLIEGHGGELSFETVEGEGTTFRIKLPALDSSE